MKKKVLPPTEPFDYELGKQKVKEQFRTGKSLYGKDGAFAPLLQDMLNSILEGEMEGHLDEEERDTGNRKKWQEQKIPENILRQHWSLHSPGSVKQFWTRDC